jgi:hypothetical protein
MGDLLKGSEGLEALPCKWACLRVPACVRMCERVKESSANSTHFPCVAAGYCEADLEVPSECKVGAFFSCSPARYCARHREGFRMTCKLRPGIGRWVGMQNALSNHAGALAAGLMRQPRCGEEGAGPYCIAEPTGLGIVAEAAGYAISFVYGGIQTIKSIESPGGDDDRQCMRAPPPRPRVWERESRTQLAASLGARRGASWPRGGGRSPQGPSASPCQLHSRERLSTLSPLPSVTRRLTSLPLPVIARACT